MSTINHLDHLVQIVGLLACVVGLGASWWALRDLQRECVIAGRDPVNRLIVWSHAPLLVAVALTQVGFVVVNIAVLMGPALPLVMYTTPDGWLALKVIFFRKLVRLALVLVLMVATLLNVRYRHQLLDLMKAPHRRKSDDLPVLPER
jgi:hypothetical protein